MAQTRHIIGAKTGLKSVLSRVNLVAPKNIPVLLHGETGSGKEVIAQAVHERSNRSTQKFVRVNCGAIAPELIDSELFGHEKGAFTGARTTHRGWFEQADKGTLFLDEIAELPLSAQVRLLRVLEGSAFARVGGEQSIQTDVRIIAATHRDLPSLIKTHRFREDLYYRLSGFPIIIPPLRERTGDIAALSEYFIARAAQRFGIKPMSLSQADIRMLQSYPWPGNIREFASVINRALLLSEATGNLQIAQALGSFNRAAANNTPSAEQPPSDSTQDDSLDAIIRAHIEKIISECHGRIEGPFGAAQRLRLNPSTLRSKMRKWQK
ncbi:MAG: sigma-54-dependent Fis family transcriptional regulator [Deltaproteobacteria bacterium]|nr:sigma-54-dependent Fis family transcriptional regulator [Deltaproteobacteria bacterium]MBN2671499.1 sigma-54-dependent Fis family transcriptional regulator [Deltaproteobacteria bacterium]